MMLYFMYIDGRLDQEQKSRLLKAPDLERFEEGPEFCMATFTKPVENVQEFDYLLPNWFIATANYGSVRNYDPGPLHVQRLTKYAESLRALFKVHVNPDPPGTEIEPVDNLKLKL